MDHLGRRMGCWGPWFYTCYWEQKRCSVKWSVNLSSLPQVFLCPDGRNLWRHLDVAILKLFYLSRSQQRKMPRERGKTPSWVRRSRSSTESTSGSVLTSLCQARLVFFFNTSNYVYCCSMLSRNNLVQSQECLRRISRLLCMIRILRMHCAIPALRKFLECMEHVYCKWEKFSQVHVRVGMESPKATIQGRDASLYIHRNRASCYMATHMASLSN